MRLGSKAFQAKACGSCGKERQQPSMLYGARLAEEMRILLNQATFSLNDSLLNTTLVEQGIEHFGDDRPLGCVLRRLQAGLPVRTAVIGGSVSAGSAYDVRRDKRAAFLYHEKVARALRLMFPTSTLVNGTHRHFNGALPGTGPRFFEHCIEAQLPTGTDLVLVEFGMNTDGSPQAYERMLRKILAYQPQPAIILVNLHAWARRTSCCYCVSSVSCSSDHRDVCQRNRLSGGQPAEPPSKDEFNVDEAQWEDTFHGHDEDTIAQLAQHYDIPLVSMRAAMLQAVRENREPTLRVPYFQYDCKHPNGQGHTYLAQLVLGRLLASQARMTRACTRGRMRMLRRPLQRHGTPMPSSVCARGDSMLRYVTDAHGFVMTDENRGKLGLVAHTPGDSLTFRLYANYSTQRSAARRDKGSPTSEGKKCLDHPPCMGCERALDELRDDRLPKLFPECSQLKPRARLGCLFKVADTQLKRAAAQREVNDTRSAVSQPSGKFCYERKSFCSDAFVQRLCPASCGMCSRLTVNSSAQANDGEEVALWIGYLHSHEHMGRAAVTCGGSCSCGALIDAHNSLYRNSVTAVQRVAITLHGDDDITEHQGSCFLHVRVLRETSSGETKFKVLSLLFAQKGKERLRGKGTRNEWMLPGVSIGAHNALDLIQGGSAKRARRRRAGR